MARATLDHLRPSLGDQLQHLDCLRSHILRARMASEMNSDSRRHRLDRHQAVALGKIDDIFRQVERRLRKPFDVRIARQQQRPFELEHQRTARGQRHYVIALLDQRAEKCGHSLRTVRDGAEIAILELRHAATLRMFHPAIDAIVR